MARRTRRQRRPPLDPSLRRYFVYRLTDASGGCLYVGRSCTPLSRLKAHHATEADWPTGVVQVEAWGPYTWDEAVRRERLAIEAEQPPFNTMFVA